MARMVDNINLPMARASILWLIGENSPTLLDIICFIYCLLQTSTHKDIIIHMARMVDNINIPMARASILWLIREYSPSLLDIIYIALFIVSFRPPHTRTSLFIWLGWLISSTCQWLEPVFCG